MIELRYREREGKPLEIYAVHDRREFTIDEIKLHIRINGHARVNICFAVPIILYDDFTALARVFEEVFEEKSRRR